MANSPDIGSIIPTFQMRKPRLQKLEKVRKVTQQWFGRPHTRTRRLLSQLPVPPPLPRVLKSTVFHPSHGTEERPRGIRLGMRSFPPSDATLHTSHTFIPSPSQPQPGRGTSPSRLLVTPPLYWLTVSLSHGSSLPCLSACVASLLWAFLCIFVCLWLPVTCSQSPIPVPSLSLSASCAVLSLYSVSPLILRLWFCVTTSLTQPPCLCFLCLFLPKATSVSHSSSLLSLPDVSLCLCLSHSHSSSPSLLLLSPQPYSPSLSPHPSQPAPSLSHPHIPTHPSLAVGTQGGMGQGHSKSRGRGARIRQTQARLFLFFLSNDWLLSWEADKKSLNRDLKH